MSSPQWTHGERSPNATHCDSDSSRRRASSSARWRVPTASASHRATSASTAAGRARAREQRPQAQEHRAASTPPTCRTNSLAAVVSQCSHDSRLLSLTRPHRRRCLPCVAMAEGPGVPPRLPLPLRLALVPSSNDVDTVTGVTRARRQSAAVDARHHDIKHTRRQQLQSVIARGSCSVARDRNDTAHGQRCRLRDGHHSSPSPAVVVGDP